jgi:hypothetical protein
MAAAMRCNGIKEKSQGWLIEQNRDKAHAQLELYFTFIGSGATGICVVVCPLIVCRSTAYPRDQGRSTIAYTVVVEVSYREVVGSRAP